MDRIECYLAGVVIASGFINEYSDIITYTDDFETPSDMFQTALNTISPAVDEQLEIARRRTHQLKRICNS